MVKPCLYQKNTKISQVWWHAPVVPATWEAEVGRSLEPGKQSRSQLRSPHCTSAWATEQDSFSKNKQTKKPSEKYTLKKIGRAWCLTPVIPALWEAEVGGSQGQEIETILVNMVKPRLY